MLLTCAQAACGLIVRHGLWPPPNAGVTVPSPSHPARPALPCLLCSMLAALCSDPRNIVYIISGRGRTELDAWFGPVVRSIAACTGLQAANRSLPFLAC